jgi:hypothetical protein
MAVHPWLEKPLIVNLEDLKVACLGSEQKPAPESGPVDQSEKSPKRADG